VSLGEKNTLEEPSGFGQLLVKGENDQTVASIDASGSATFAKVNIASAYDEAETATDSAQVATNASAGQGLLAAGELEVQIITEQLTENSLVYITPVSDTENRVLYVKEKNEAYFTVALNEALENTVEFNWWIIN